MEPELKDTELKPDSEDAELKKAELKQHVDCFQADFYSCEEAVQKLNEYLDHQLTEAEKFVVLKHLEICRPCLKRFSFEQTLLVSLRQKVQHLCVSATLREKLHILLRDKE